MVLGPVIGNLIGMSGDAEAGAVGAIAAGVISVVGVGAIVLGIVLIFVSIGLWKQRNWARIVAIVLAALGILGLFRMLFIGNLPAIGAIVIDVFLIWFYAFNQQTRTVFATK
jgi:uncharacterized membrane protein